MDDDVLRVQQNTRISRHRLDVRKERSFNIGLLKVTTSAGNTFDADEKSQQRMARAILVIDDVEQINWTLADNTVVPVTKAELTEALRNAVIAQSDAWGIE